MRRDQLIGTWKLVGTRLGGQAVERATYELILHLNEDGTAVTEHTSKSGQYARDEPRWAYVGPRRWRLRLAFPPDPDTPGMEEGVVEVMEYEIKSSTGDRMEVTTFDYEFAFVYERIPDDRRDGAEKGR